MLYYSWVRNFSGELVKKKKSGCVVEEFHVQVKDVLKIR